MKDGCMHMYKIAIFFKRDFSFALGSYCENALFLHGVSRSGEKEKKTNLIFGHCFVTI